MSGLASTARGQRMDEDVWTGQHSKWSAPSHCTVPSHSMKAARQHSVLKLAQPNQATQIQLLAQNQEESSWQPKPDTTRTQSSGQGAGKDHWQWSPLPSM